VTSPPSYEKARAPVDCVFVLGYDPAVNLILLEPGEVDAQGRVVLRDARARHVRDVLRGEAGGSVRCGVVDGPRGVARIEAVSADSVALRCEFEAAPPPAPRVDLLLALPRPKVMNRLWAQLAAIGVGRIILTNACKVERVYFDTHVLREDHYRPLLIEGLQQAQDTRLPRVSIHRQFRKLVEDELDELCPGGRRLLADPRSEQRLATMPPCAAGDRVLLAVGPEGGWTDFETNLLLERGFTPVSMGARTLRSDTACIALLALAHEVCSTSRRGS